MSKRRSRQAPNNSPQNSASKIEAFLQFVSNNKLLTLVYSFFIPCLIFVVNFYVQAPNKWLDFEQKSRDIDFFLLESEKVDTVYGAIIDILDASVKADTAYFEIINKIKDEKAIPPDDEIKKSAEIINQSSVTVIINIDILKGIKISDPRLSDYPGEFAQNAEILKTTIEKAGTVLATIRKGEYNLALQSIQEHSSAWYQGNNTVLELYARTKSFSETAMKVSSDQEISIQKDTNDIKYFRLQQFLTIPAIVFLVSVVFYTIHRFNLFSKKKR